MASDADVIKEYLVGVGFDVDQNSLKKFAAVLGETTVAVLGIATAIAAAATATVAFVTKMAESFDDLYWAGQRIGASVAQLQNFALAVQDMGGTAAGAMGSLEGLASFLRSNPGAEGFINSLGVQTRDAHGALIDRVKVMEQLGQKFRQMPFYIAKAYASFMGIDERTLLAIENGGFGGVSHRFTDLYKAGSINADAAAKGAHDFMVQMRNLEAATKVIGAIMMTRLLPAATWLTRNMITASEGFLRWLDTPAAHQLGGSLESLWTSITGLTTTIGKMADKFLKFINLGDTDALARVVNSLAGTLDLINALLNADIPKIKQHAKQAANDFSDWFTDTLGNLGFHNLKTGEKPREFVQDHSDLEPVGGGLPLKDKNVNSGYVSPAINKLLSIIKTAGLPGDVKYVTSLDDDYHHIHNPNSEHAKGLAVDVALVDPSKGGAAAAAVQSLLNKSGVRGKAVNEYDPAKRSAWASAGHLHIQFNSAADADKFLQQFSATQGVVNTAKQVAQVAHAAVSRAASHLRSSVPHSTSYTTIVNARAAELSKRAAPAPHSTKVIHITQTNNTTVNGASQPHDVGKQVGKMTTRYNGDLLRNLKGAVG